MSDVVKMVCRRCGKEFSTNNLQRRYCSDQCQMRAKHDRERERSRSVYKEKKKECEKRKNNAEAIESIANRAWETERMSYGKYVAKYGL